MSKTEFMVTELVADAEMVRGGGTIINAYVATLVAADHQVTPDGERGQGEIYLRRTSNKFPWCVGDVVELPIPWDGDSA